MAETITSTLTAAHGKITRAFGMIWLLRVEQKAPTGGEIRLAWWSDDVSYDRRDGFGALTYRAISGAIQETSQEDGSLEQLSITISNVSRFAQGKLEDDLILDQRVELLLVDHESLDVRGHHQTLRYFLEEAIATPRQVALTLGSGTLMQHVFPKDRFLPDRCRHPYEGGTNPTVDGRCAATAVAETCDKAYSTSTGCAGRANQARYGGFPHSLEENDLLLG